ncbi:hypothetical protein BOFE_09380 (plasmid) [Candidatus Borrelia fainii]|uniref:Uncharacterized protein n=1 Tax=Candidatus Borrelia fainii TaxID=2518322 RepID=A0ABM8DLD4_9SPIR|nr:hypothetical protein BOFE_09380 [Candidatus Borrelia fainii]
MVCNHVFDHFVDDKYIINKINKYINIYKYIKCMNKYVNINAFNAFNALKL